MQCPKCDKAMLTVELHNVEIDYCPVCKGVWLDTGELEILAESAGSESKLLGKIVEAENVNEVKLKCPICSKKMLKVCIENNSGLILDKCINGDGYWLNKGELESVLSLWDDTDSVVSLLKGIFNYKV